MARFSYPLSETWKFQADPTSEGSMQKWYERGLPDAQEVSIPHTWNVQEGLEEFRGTGWYSYSVFGQPEWEGQLLRLQFDAVYRDATVWVNGQHAGEHANAGYTSFVLDVSGLIAPGQDNLIVVSVNNENSMTALPLSNSFDWPDDGGIIRGVSLIVTGQYAMDYTKLKAVPVFTDEGNSAAYGVLSGDVFLTTEKSAVLDVPLIMKIGIFREDSLIAQQEIEVRSKGNPVQLPEIRVEQPHLWHFDHPHLYTVSISLTCQELMTDEWKGTIGFREIQAQGHLLLLNREPVRLMGVEWMPGSHPDHGMAETEEQWIEMLEHIKHANCVITRFHWQQDSKLLDWCDRHGLLVQEEIPHWQTPTDPDDTWLERSRQHASEMINRHYNHPCIYAWGLGNEVNGQSPATVHFFRELKSLVHEMDDTRFINYVSNTVHENPGLDATGVGDLIMWNDYIGTWHGDLDRPAVIRSISEDYPDQPIIVAEFGLCEPAFAGGDARRGEILVENTLEYRKHPGIAALIYFSLNDYRTQMGEDGEGRLRQRIHGSMDCYGMPKPSYEVLRELGSPLELSAVCKPAEKDGLELSITIRDSIPSYTLTGYTLTVHDPAGGTTSITLPIMSPGKSYVVSLDGIAADHWQQSLLQIQRPTGFSVVSGELIEFMDI